MSRSTSLILATGAATTVVIGLLDDQGWPSYVIGAVLALVMAVMLFFGSLAAGQKYRITPRDYALASLLAVVIGGAFVWMTGTSAFWSVGFIVAGTLWPAAGLARRERAD